MIVPMKKIAIIARSVDAEETVKDLRQFGLLHVEHQQQPQGKDIAILQEELGLLDEASAVLTKDQDPQKGAIFQEKAGADWRALARHLVDLKKRYEQLEIYAQKLKDSIAEWEKWGDFEPQELKGLSQKGVYAALYKAPAKNLNAFPREAVVKTIDSKGGIAYCAVFALNTIEAPFKPIAFPQHSLSYMQKRLSQDAQEMHLLKDQIKKLFRFYQDFLSIRQNLEKEIELQQAIKGMAAVGALTYIVGYAPQESQGKFLERAKTSGWAISISDPAEEDNPPVLLRNPKWASLIDPVYKLMEVVPGYRELDVSPLFLLFLALFFGMIIGDAGYGAVYFALTFIAQRKFGAKARDKKAFFLFYLFSFCAIIWGLLTGTVFGQQWYLAKGFRAFLPALNDAKVLMDFCFLLGALQLSLAHGWQAAKKLPSLAALSDVGFICLLWVGFLLAKMFILGAPFPVIGERLAWIGVVLIILFVSPKENLLKSIGAGCGTLALGLMGNFGDVVSYIRLFAVGLAGVAVADSVNILAGASGNIIAQVLILFVGHSINIILGPMSVLVHGIRLNVLEFSLLHGNVTWSGLAYKPLKE